MRWTDARNLVHIYDLFNKSFNFCGTSKTVRLLFVSSQSNVDVSNINIQVQDTSSDTYEYLLEGAEGELKTTFERQRAKARR